MAKRAGKAGPSGAVVMNLFLRLSQGSRRTILATAAILVGIIVLVDWKNPVNAYFGFLYVFPMLLVGAVLPSWQIALIALGCTLLAETFDPFPFIPAEAGPQDILLFIALAGMGLFSREATVNRRLEVENRLKVEKEAATRREAEEQLAFLIQTSPAGNHRNGREPERSSSRTVRQATFSASRRKDLFGRNISRYIPALGRVPSAEQGRPSALRCSAPAKGTTARYSWPPSSFPLTRPPSARAWPPSWWTRRRTCGGARNTAWSSS